MSEFIPLTYEAVLQNPYVNAYIARADEYLEAIGYTEHGLRHTKQVGQVARAIMTELGAPERDREIAAIGGLLHDIGNLVTRNVHAQSGAAIAHQILREMCGDPWEIAAILACIGNHDENDGLPVSGPSAAVIIADKTDVHRDRVRHEDPRNFDIHDRVNYAVVNSTLHVNQTRRLITLELVTDPSIASAMEYFEIFTARMVMCRKAAEFLQCRFQMTINQFSVM